MASNPNFTIHGLFQISNRFEDLNITDFHSACKYVQKIPFGRNSNKTDLLNVLDENKGTSSTKHALLFKLCEENGVHDYQLMLGIYKMNVENTPAIKPVLTKYKLPYLPEAHNYLKYKDQYLDYTFAKSAIKHKDEMMKEIPMSIDEIGAYKTKYYKDYLDKWLTEKPEAAFKKYTTAQLMDIREECIKAMEL